ncbi:ABC transporter permease/M1 family aminopeptidase [Flavobacterium acetivorans]|uniref:ABC transporter permease/M1 family aminopeptidase n=1 Tax=Flavobacterium acetivorans TaxID=2893883 RepID=UPI001E4B184C|nr:M1 family aminopeptidase [Flavobacterium sp. F-29]UFH34519.1 peptidase M1 [Flavobacterium sp. F-29]
MLYEFFIFEIKYRLKRPETFFFFLLLFLFSAVGVEFVFQGIDLGLVKKNSPLVIAKSMGAITGLSMIIASMIMGVPVLRDFQYDITLLIYVNPISRKNYLLGRFLGSFAVLLFIFSGVLWGMTIGEFLPWNDPSEFLPFQFINYLQPFLWVVLPTLFFGAAVFFATGTLSKNLMVVYTQGVVIFVLFMITKGITNETFQALLDPFSLTTLTKATKGWTVMDRNSLLIPVSGIMLLNKLFWLGLGILALTIGYIKFQLVVLSEKTFNKKQKQKVKTFPITYIKVLPSVTPVFHIKAQFTQLLLNAWFHSLSILRLISFWAIILCCFIIILVNSVSLGTSYGVDSYPTTYFIIEELREMSIYFFMIILVFYSGEIMWKERDVKLNLIHDASPFSSFINVSSRFLGLLFIYVIVMLSLIAAGILFQTLNGYYRYELDVYFFGFFLELFPFLALYTFAAMFFQAFTGNKFMGMLATIAFAIINVAIGVFGLEHALLNFGGQALATYSDMNGYGHFLTAYLWAKTYWVLFGLLLLIFASVLMVKGTETGLRKRWTNGLKQMGKSLRIFSLVCLTLIVSIGSYIFYNTNVLNEFWTKGEQDDFRAGYEKTLKQFEYIPQPKIIDVNLKINLFPSKRAYEITGYYIVTNTSQVPIREIHVQKLLESNVELTDVSFDRNARTNNRYKKYHYTIYQLSQSLAPGDTLKMNFKQTLRPKGFETDNSDIDVVYNGTFFDNAVLPSFGYQKKYELQDEDGRKDFELAPRLQKARRDDIRELVNARSGSDSDGITLDIVISTEAPQTALTSGDLVKAWDREGRNYFHYKTNQQIINFYPVVSGEYEVMRNTFIPSGNSSNERVVLEIYYQKGHEYNLKRMMKSMKMSLDYYSKHFSPYQYKQLRIVEFPRYRAFAQSLPGIIPFSEAIGFVMNIDDKKDVDMAFYITAHEVAHQWWGLQLEAANVQGQNMILETLAQYSAIMVLKEKYPDKKVQQFLKFQLDEYTEANLKSSKKELPLALVENEEHIYYNKGAIAMYELQKQIGEENVNTALQHFLNDWHSLNNSQKPNRYATTADLIKYFHEVAPDSKQQVITDLFEQVNSIK